MLQYSVISSVYLGEAPIDALLPFSSSIDFLQMINCTQEPRRCDQMPKEYSFLALIGLIMLKTFRAVGKSSDKVWRDVTLQCNNNTKSNGLLC